MGCLSVEGRVPRLEFATGCSRPGGALDLAILDSTCRGGRLEVPVRFGQRRPCSALPGVVECGGTRGDAAQARQAGINAYLTKPLVTPRVSTLDAVMGRGITTRPAAHEFIVHSARASWKLLTQSRLDGC